MGNNAIDRDLAMRLLTDAVAADPKGKAGVSSRLGAGCGRSLLSRVISPSDPLEISEKLAKRVIDIFHVIPVCPATGAQQPRSECHRLSAAKAPTHNPGAMRVWKTCQTCQHKPAIEGDAK